ncbi:hypothetical protein [Crocosphaera sp. Alani8]|uniref:hypothetical protein n=1 Tax=Crocosphaera sp. Alani8 TaxID=3038952 RepID=UPI00313C60FE
MVRRSIQCLPILLAVFLLTVSVIIISHEFKDHNPLDILHYLAALTTTRKIGVIALTSFGYFIMTGYDFLGFHYISERLKPSKIILTAFISYAIGNTVGFAVLSGTAIRYRFYGIWGISKVKIAQLMIFININFWLRLLGVSGVVFLIYPLSLPDVLNLPFKSAYFIGFIFLVLVSIYLIISYLRKRPFQIGSQLINFPSTNVSLTSIFLASMDWGVASGVLYLLLPLSGIISFPGFFGIYILGLTAGLLSTVPGGLGVFETVILFSLPNTIPQANILGGLIAYRAIYYFLPLLVAMVLLIFKEIQQQRT